MSEWNSVISVLGTLGGSLGGLLVGYWVSSRIEAKKEKHEMKMEYRKELTKHIDDIIKPLFHLTQELWGSLAMLNEFLRTRSAKGRTLPDLVMATKKALQDLRKFVYSNDAQIDLLFPHQLSSWVFVPIDEKVNKIIAQVSEGFTPINEMNQTINALMIYQENLKSLIGYETDQKLEDAYPFPEK